MFSATTPNIPWVSRGQANYAWAKAGLVGLTKTICKVSKSLMLAAAILIFAYRYLKGMGPSIRCPSQHVGSFTFVHSISSRLILINNRVSFGAVQTRLTTGKDKGNSITLSDGTEVALGIPGATEKSSTGNRYADIPLQRAATPFEAAATVLAIVSPLMSYVDGQTIEVTGGKWI